MTSPKSKRRTASKEKRRLQLTDAVVLVAEQLSFGERDRPIERSLSALHPERHPLSLMQDATGRTLGA